MFGSKKHMMMNIFQSKKMPFYQFGDTTYLQKIPSEEWIKFITSRFKSSNKEISEYFAAKICEYVECHSSYVQQLAANVLLETNDAVNEEVFNEGVNTLFDQNTELFLKQTEGLTTYQMNFLRAICSGYHSEFTSKEVSSLFDLGAKSNITRIKNTLIQKELIDNDKKDIIIPDPVFRKWFIREYM